MLDALQRQLESWILGDRAAVVANLGRLSASGRLPAVPTPWQVCHGVGYMLHRILTRPDSIGLSTGEPVRATLRARVLAPKPVRFFALCAERAIQPLDLTGLRSTPPFLERHLLGAYHPGRNATYDLEILSAWPGALERLRALVAAIVDGRHPRATWLRDLTVYEGYHERLLGLIDEALAAREAPAAVGANPDTDLATFLHWCTTQPATLDGSALRAARALLRGVLPRPARSA